MDNEWRGSKPSSKNILSHRRPDVAAARPGASQPAATKPPRAVPRPPITTHSSQPKPIVKSPVNARAAMRGTPTPLQLRPSATRTQTAQPAARQTPPRATNPKTRQGTVQPFASRIVQATKFYPNLHPGAVESVDPENVFRLNNFANQYRLRRVNSHGVNVPNQQYNFVRTREGEMLLHARYRHPSIAEGKQVLYAGEIFFNNGQLEWWSNGSGHYQPDAEDAGQANLPMDQFYSYQQVIKGEHKRKKG